MVFLATDLNKKFENWDEFYNFIVYMEL